MPRLHALAILAAAACAALLLGTGIRHGAAVQTLPAGGAEIAVAATDDGVIRVATYNIHWGLGVDGAQDLDRIAGVLRNIDADVVLLTEVDVYWRRSGNVHQARYLAEAAGYPYWYFAPAFATWASGALRRSQYGNLLLSRFPILEARTVPLPNSLLREPRAALKARLAVGEQPLIVIGAHLGFHRTERLAQAAALRELAAAEDPCAVPLVLMGDFNASPEAAEIQLLSSPAGGLVDAHLLAGSGDGYTFPAYAPRVRIDYVLVSPGLAAGVIAARTVEADGSDHLPVVADLRWPPALCPPVATSSSPR